MVISLKNNYINDIINKYENKLMKIDNASFGEKYVEKRSAKI